MSKLIIIPDVHGRSFWRDAVVKYPHDEFIFLGDYLDPYPYEGIDAAEAFSGLQDIVRLWKERPGKVTLLLGNHDLHYLHGELEGSRFDVRHAGRNAAFFKANMSAFQLAYEREAAGERHLFTHAGVGHRWLSHHIPGLKDEQITADFFNRCYPRKAFIKTLADVSYFRWGMSEYGSPVWADVQEQCIAENQIPGVIQIFGHTMVNAPVNLYNRIYCLDCQRPFYLDLEKGGLYECYTDNLVTPCNTR